jgi:hypothetical protein
MTRLQAVVRLLVTFLTSVLALSAIPGGVMLLAGIYAPPVEQLEGSVFASFLLPGLALLVVVGGGALLAAVLLVRRSRLAPAAAGFAGASVMAFEFVEVLAIGSPPGPALVMQVGFFALGLALVGLSLVLREISEEQAGGR